MKTRVILIMAISTLLIHTGRTMGETPRRVEVSPTVQTSVPAEEIAEVAATVVTVRRFQTANRPVQIAYVGGIVEALSMLGLTCRASFPTVEDTVAFLSENPAASSSTFSAAAVMGHLRTRGCSFSQDSDLRQVREFFRFPAPPVRDTQVALR